MTSVDWRCYCWMLPCEYWMLDQAVSFSTFAFWCFSLIQMIDLPVLRASHQSGFCKPWWRHQMETFSALLALCEGNSPVTGEFPHKGQWRGALTFSLIYDWINGWVNNREAGDLRRHRAHYDVIVMPMPSICWQFIKMNYKAARNTDRTINSN